MSTETSEAFSDYRDHQRRMKAKKAARKSKQEEPNLTTEAWREYKQQSKEARAKQRSENTESIDAIAGDFDVSKKADSQFRINDEIDLYPTSLKYHDLKTGNRGFYPKGIKPLAKWLSKRLNVEIDLSIY